MKIHTIVAEPSAKSDRLPGLLTLRLTFGAEEEDLALVKFTHYDKAENKSKVSGSSMVRGINFNRRPFGVTPERTLVIDGNVLLDEQVRTFILNTLSQDERFVLSRYTMPGKAAPTYDRDEDRQTVPAKSAPDEEVPF